MVVLYGRLDVVVVEGHNLPNLDSTILNPANKSDPYCVVEVQGSSGTYRLGKTYTINDCLNPKWYYKLVSDLRQDVSQLIFTVKDRDNFTSQVIGKAFLPVQSFVDYPFEGSLQISSPKGLQAGELKISIKYSGSKDTPEKTSFHHKLSLRASEVHRAVNRAVHWRSGDSKGQSFSQSDMAAFLHGTLDIIIEKAFNLPNLDSSILSFKKTDVSDPYVVVALEDEEGGSWRVATTSVIDNDLNPVWDEKFKVEVCHHIVAITFGVRDKDLLSSETIGTVSFTAESIMASGGIRGTFDLFRNKTSKKAGQLSLSICYISKQHTMNTPEVPGCLFPLRSFNRVTLYQDAHCPMLPKLVMGNSGYPHVPRSTWRDIYETIAQAQIFIYIVGWSVSAKIPLLRWAGEDNTPLGHLLLNKARQGVRVRLLLWDELTSNDLHKAGAMSTEDEETMNFFKDSPVVVKLAPRDRHTKTLSTKTSFTKICYTHHQKCVIADMPSPECPPRRHIVAYVGGLDLTGGRFDTPEHPLFRTLIAEHKDDFRNKMHLNSPMSGPREPWHDIHSRVEGPTALDVLQNFQERWDKQGDKSNNIEYLRGQGILDMNYRVTSFDNWSVQLFRSINSDSAIFDWRTSLGSGLTNKKGRAFDNSLHRAYIHQIRKARRFIYIENQYFLGSSHCWLDCRDAKAGNLVPLEIASRIVEKIRAGERFSVYIVIPMFPEGKPADKVTQEILHWQYRTMQMMYKRVAIALAEVGSAAHPQDYLLFLCLGNKVDHENVPPELFTPEDPSAAAAFQSRRLMIYVHSKMAVFDDEYFIIGSANINDRSLSGNRDTEIAIGGYQAAHVGNGDQLARGDVSLFRRSLWSEHLGTEAPIDEDPGTVECIRRVKNLSEEALRIYADSAVQQIPRHMLLYPLEVQQDGSLLAHPQCMFIPDTTATVIGARSKVFPSSLTT